MGIPRFFAWLAKDARVHLADLKPGNYLYLIRQKPANSYSLSLDMNGLIHRALEKVAPSWGTANFEFNFANTFKQDLTNLINHYDVSQTLILAVDGVAPTAKINQQRQRRYRSVIMPPPKEGPRIDKNLVTPGTDFMNMVDQTIEEWIEESRNILPPQVYFSSSRVEGEGEHKIMDFYRRSDIIPPQEEHLLYGLDADLILLSMLAKPRYITLVREDQPDMLDINQLRLFIADAMKLYDEKNRLRTRQAARDFVVLMNLLGNDFLPRQISFFDTSSAISKLIHLYVQLKLELTNPSGIRFNHLAQFIKNLVKYEEEHLIKLSQRKDLIPYRSIENALETHTDQAGRSQQYFNFNSFREYYYHYEMGPVYYLDQITAVDNYYRQYLGPQASNLTITNEDVDWSVTKYLEGFEWIFQYYAQRNRASSLWNYPLHRAPLVADLNRYLSLTSENDWKNLQQSILRPENELAYSAIHQLLAVLPPQSFNFLPQEVSRQLDGLSSIFDLMPINFKLDYSGLPDPERQASAGKLLKDFSYLATVQLPIVDMVRIIEATQNITLSTPLVETLVPQRIKSYRNRRQQGNQLAAKTQQLARLAGPSERPPNINQKIVPKLEPVEAGAEDVQSGVIRSRREGQSYRLAPIPKSESELVYLADKIFHRYFPPGSNTPFGSFSDKVTLTSVPNKFPPYFVEDKPEQSRIQKIKRTKTGPGGRGGPGGGRGGQRPGPGGGRGGQRPGPGRRGGSQRPGPGGPGGRGGQISSIRGRSGPGGRPSGQRPGPGRSSQSGSSSNPNQGLESQLRWKS